MPVTQGLHYDLRRMIPPLALYSDARVLAANTAETVTVPAAAAFAFFSCTEDFYAKRNGTAAVPSADVADGTAAELNPTARAVTPGDTISVISESAAILTVSWYGSEGVSQ